MCNLTMFQCMNSQFKAAPPPPPQKKNTRAHTHRTKELHELVHLAPLRHEAYIGMPQNSIKLRHDI